MAKHYDVIVVGGGMAGVCAAISARRQGCSVLLVEKQILLGGMATLGRINWLEPYCDGHGTDVLSGMARELFDHAVSCGYQSVPEGWRQGSGRLSSWFSPEACMLELARWVCTEGVELLLDALVTEVQLRDDRIQSVRVDHFSGNEVLSADGFVDATGGAQLFYLAGFPCREGENYLTMIADVVRRENLKQALDTGTPYRVRGRKNYGSTMSGKGPEEAAVLQCVRTAWDETQWVRHAQELMRRKLAAQSPTEHEIISLPALAQLRVLRRIIGKVSFTGTPSQAAEDSIGVIPDFRTAGLLYELPFDCLRNENCKNMYAAGRCISARDEGSAVSRVIGPCCLTGQAAGLAAALKGSIHAVQRELRNSGVPLHIEELNLKRKTPRNLDDEEL